MSLSIQNLSVIIVTFMSEHVIHNCINSLPKDIKIIIVDNSGSKSFKETIEKKYQNVKCLVSNTNLGMGAGNNLGLKAIKTDYAFILNPDVLLEQDTIDELIKASNDIRNFGIISPISSSKEYPNFNLFKEVSYKNTNIPFKVKSVDGYAMLFNVKKLNQLNDFKNFNFFDENFFLYLENDDLCERLTINKEDIYVVPSSKIKHIGSSAVDKKYSFQIELSRNWHWIWSKFYFNKKYKGYSIAFFNGLPSFFSAVVKFLFFKISKNEKKSLIYQHRYMGFISAVLGKKSYYRPKLDI